MTCEALWPSLTGSESRSSLPRFWYLVLQFPSPHSGVLLPGCTSGPKRSRDESDTYTALQFRVSGAAVQFDRIVVEYGNHSTRAYPFRILVPPNGSSRVLDLVGGERDIASVKFWYEKASWGNKPEVRLYGRR